MQYIVADFGCGWQKVKGSIGFDICHYNNDVVCDLFNSPLRDASVNKVVARQFVEHIDSQRFIRECWRVLKVGGIIHLETRNALYIFNILRALRNQETNPCPWHIQTFTSAELRNLLEKNGFQCVSIQFEVEREKSRLKQVILGLATHFPMLRINVIVVGIKRNRPFANYITELDRKT